MYTGIIDHCGTILEANQSANALKIVVRCQFTDIEEGESIAVDGICLTAVHPQKNQFSADISPETLKLTTAHTFTLNRKINLERSLRMGDRVGGHWVMGHVDQCGKIQKITQKAEFFEYNIGDLPRENMQYLFKKGSIAINGVSLTVNEVLADGFQVMLIPHTLERTNLSLLSIGDEVNLEFDWMARVIVNQYRKDLR